MTTITEAVTRYCAGELTFEELVDDLGARTWRAPVVHRNDDGDSSNDEGSWLELARAWAANVLDIEKLRAIEARVRLDVPDYDDSPVGDFIRGQITYEHLVDKVGHEALLAQATLGLDRDLVPGEVATFAPSWRYLTDQHPDTGVWRGLFRFADRRVPEYLNPDGQWEPDGSLYRYTLNSEIATELRRDEAAVMAERLTGRDGFRVLAQVAVFPPTFDPEREAELARILAADGTLGDEALDWSNPDGVVKWG